MHVALHVLTHTQNKRKNFSSIYAHPEGKKVFSNAKYLCIYH